jgi:hypothetical protein
MRIDAPSPKKLYAIAGRVSLFLLILGGWLVDAFAETPFDRWARTSAIREFRLAVRAVRRIALLLGSYAYTPTPRLRSGKLPANTPLGCRSRPVRGHRRFMPVRGLHQGSLRTRVRRLRKLISELTALAARITARMLELRTAPAITLTAPIADAVTGAVCAAPVSVDSS